MSYDLDTRPLYRSEEPPRSPVSPSPLAAPRMTVPPPVASAPEAKKLDLSLTQVAGGALAAMTAAALGSRLGVAGTVIGAAVASVLAAVLGALYTASLRRTRETVRTAFRPRGGATTTKPAASRYPGVLTAVTPLTVPSPPPRQPVRWWPRILLGTLATFVLAGGALTGFELLTGHALSGGPGTTIEKVQTPQRTGSTGEGAAQAEPSASTTPSSSASVEPVPSTSPSSTPSAQPSDAPTAQPSSDLSSSTGSRASDNASSTPAPSAAATGESPA